MVARTAVPFVSKTFAMAYNKDLFDRAGVDYPTSDWTEEDMLDAAEKINALGDDIYGLAGKYVFRNFIVDYTATCIITMKTRL
ncbi:MAG: extracellular solute-binding protein [Blautia faecis]